MAPMEPANLSSELLIKALDSEARRQAARADMATAKKELYADLYALWRECKDPRVVAAHMPPSVTARTVKAAVVALAPAQDFVQEALIPVEAVQPEQSPVTLAA